MKKREPCVICEHRRRDTGKLCSCCYAKRKLGGSHDGEVRCGDTYMGIQGFVWGIRERWIEMYLCGSNTSVSSRINLVTVAELRMCAPLILNPEGTLLLAEGQMHVDGCETKQAPVSSCLMYVTRMSQAN